MKPILYRSLFACTLVMSCCFEAWAGPLVRSATGIATTDISAARDAFRVDIGGGTTAGSNGSFLSIRREINWDGVGEAFSAPNSLPANFFNSNSPRGVEFSTPGSSVQVSANAGNGTATPVRFGNINASYENDMATFTAQKLFTAIGSNIIDVDFFVAGTSTPATVTAFGAVFADVDLSTSSFVEFFDVNDVSLGRFFVPGTEGTATFSFLGVSFNEGEKVARVRIQNGNAAPASGVVDTATVDVATTDDFIYSEPAAAATVVTPTVLSPNGGEQLLVGSSQAVTWTQGLAGGNVKIELSRNNGSTFETVSASTSDDGTENVTVTGPATSTGLFRISSLNDVTKVDSSNAVFTIVAGVDLSASLDKVKLVDGRVLRGNIIVSNTGTTSASSIVVDVFGSKNNSLGAGDLLVARKTIASLAAGASTTLSFRSNLNRPSALKKITAIGVVDSTNVVAESNEANNTVSKVVKAKSSS